MVDLMMWLQRLKNRSKDKELGGFLVKLLAELFKGPALVVNKLVQRGGYLM